MSYLGFSERQVALIYAGISVVNIILSVIIFNYIFFEKGNYHKVIVQKFRQHKKQKVYNLIGVIFPLISFFSLLLYIDLSIKIILIVSGIVILFEILGIYFGNKWE